MPVWNPENHDAWYSTPLGRVSHGLERELILQLADTEKGQVILDVGSGTGVHSIALAGKVAKVVALDSSIQMLEHARAKSMKQDVMNVGFVCGSALHLPFPDNHFDALFSVCMLCFVKERATAILEMKRVLKPGGKMVVGVLNKWSVWAFLRRLKGIFAETIYNDAHFFTPRELKGALDEAGLSDVRLKSCLFFLPVDLGLYLAFSGLHEAIGSALAPDTGAFLAASATKK